MARRSGLLEFVGVETEEGSVVGELDVAGGCITGDLKEGVEIGWRSGIQHRSDPSWREMHR